MNESDLIGTWTLREWRTWVGQRAGATPAGADALGQLIYTAEGTMSAIINQRARPAFSGPYFSTGSDADQLTAARGCIAYAGSWHLQANRVVHHVRYSLFPNWVGEDLIRTAVLSDKTLTLSAHDQVTRKGEPVVHEIVWHRAA